MPKMHTGKKFDGKILIGAYKSDLMKWWQFCATPCYATPCYAVLRRALPRHASPWCALSVFHCVALADDSFAGFVRCAVFRCAACTIALLGGQSSFMLLIAACFIAFCYATLHVFCRSFDRFASLLCVSVGSPLCWVGPFGPWALRRLQVLSSGCLGLTPWP